MTQVWFSATGPGGDLVELRVLEPHHLLALLDDLPAVPDEAGGPDVDADAAARAWREAFDGLMEIRPHFVTVNDDATNPVWWVQPRSGDGHLATLAHAMSLLDGADRTAALGAHLGSLGELVDHERAVRAVDDGGWDQDGFDPRCVACWAEPESHALALAEAVADRARELADALGQFPHRLDALDAAPSGAGTAGGQDPGVRRVPGPASTPGS